MGDAFCYTGDQHLQKKLKLITQGNGTHGLLGILTDHQVIS